VREKGGGMVSIGHRQALERYHEKEWELVPSQGPAAYRLQAR
jgi:hypothetical protein